MLAHAPHPKNQHDRGHQKPSWPVDYTPRVVVKFNDEDVQRLKIPYDKRVEQNPERYLGQNWSHLVGQFPGITFQRLITAMTPDEIVALVARGQRRKRDQNYTSPNFLTYFAVRCPSNLDPYVVLQAVSSWPIVGLAYVESGPLPPPNLTLSALEDPSLSGQQRYLLAAPVGIDAQYAWAYTGGDGGGTSVGLQFVDIEQGWILNHQDLPPGIQLIHGNNRQFFGHGTGALGIVLAVPNNVVNLGPMNNINTKVGIAPNVATSMVTSIWPDATNQYVDRVNAILAAISGRNPGDVILLEDHVYASGTYNGVLGWYRVPIEVEDAIFHIIKDVAIANDIIVVEAAGNAAPYTQAIDLDYFVPNGTYYSAQQGSPVTATHWGQDSGAIIVAAADSSINHQRGYDSNFGSQVACWAWDNNIWTTGYDDDSPAPLNVTTADFAFSGTSGASAIIAGAVLAIQGIAQVNQKGDLSNFRFSPSALRQFLKDPSNNGTPSLGGTADKIGLMPNLRGIINHHWLGLKHHLILSDYGEPLSLENKAGPDPAPGIKPTRSSVNKAPRRTLKSSNIRPKS